MIMLSSKYVSITGSDSFLEAITMCSSLRQLSVLPSGWKLTRIGSLHQHLRSNTCLCLFIRFVLIVDCRHGAATNREGKKLCTHCSNSLDGFQSIMLMRIVCALRLLFCNYFMIIVYVRWHSTSGQKCIHNHQYFSSTHVISYKIFSNFLQSFFRSSPFSLPFFHAPSSVSFFFSLTCLFSCHLPVYWFKRNELVKLSLPNENHTGISIIHLLYWTHTHTHKHTHANSLYFSTHSSGVDDMKQH